MPGTTNKFKKVNLNSYFTADVTDTPAGFSLRLCTNATAPTADTNVITDLTELPTANGYTSGGEALSRNNTDFDVVTEDDGTDTGFVQVRDVSWTAATSALIFRYVVLCDDAATPNILAWDDLLSDQTVPVGVTFTEQNFQITAGE